MARISPPEDSREAKLYRVYLSAFLGGVREGCFLEHCAEHNYHQPPRQGEAPWVPPTLEELYVMALGRADAVSTKMTGAPPRPAENLLAFLTTLDKLPQ